MRNITSMVMARLEHPWRSSFLFRLLIALVIFITILAIPASFLIINIVFKNPSLGLGIMFIPASIYILSIPFRALKRGIFTAGSSVSISVYDRFKNPFGFWFYIVFYSFIGALISFADIIFIVFQSEFNNSIMPHL
jgi:hypothetical protein